jgi:hypothetical protein
MSSRSRSTSSRTLPEKNGILPDWIPAQKGDHATCAENCPGPANQKGCLTARQELSRRRVGLASPDNSDTHDSNDAGRGPASKHPQDCASAWRRTLWIQQRQHRRRSYKLHIGCFSTRLERRVAASVKDWSRRSYRLHSDGSGGGPETSPVEDQSRRTSREPAAGHGQAAEWPELGLREQESAHCWTGTTYRAAALACSN